MKKSVLVVAGEASGDTLGGAIIAAWKKQKSFNKKNMDFWGYGGPQMEKVGVRTIRSVDELATIGFWEGLKKYRKLKGYAHDLANMCKEAGVKHAVLIDYPGFNLYLASLLKADNIEVYLVVSPQIWAWHYSRIHKIKKFVHSVLCLYKFETAIFEKEGVNSHFIGHPVVDKIKEAQIKLKSKANKLKTKYKNRIRIAILPGSRISEIKRHLPFMLECARRFKSSHTDAEFFIPTPTDTIDDLVHTYELPEYVHVYKADSHLILQSTSAAIACSGTVTLECSLFNLPFLLIYQTSFVTYHIAKRLIQGEYIGLVNIIGKKPITKEFIQNDMKLEPVLEELDRLLTDKPYRKQMLANLREVNKNVISKNPAEKAAALLAKFSK
ncbi:MAG: lipid-A-disaccharide synthase [Leptospirales bacterium]